MQLRYIYLIGLVESRCDGFVGLPENGLPLRRCDDRHRRRRLSATVPIAEVCCGSATAISWLMLETARQKEIPRGQIRRCGFHSGPPSTTSRFLFVEERSNASPRESLGDVPEGHDGGIPLAQFEAADVSANLHPCCSPPFQH